MPKEPCAFVDDIKGRSNPDLVDFGPLREVACAILREPFSNRPAFHSPYRGSAYAWCAFDDKFGHVFADAVAGEFEAK